MKKILFSAAVAAMCLTACSTEEPSAELSASIKTDTAPMKPVKITFNCRGDFDLSTQPFSTRTLTADGKSITDLWILDYTNGSLAQDAIHRVSTDEDFGTPTLNLSVGDHHVYFIASRGQNPTLDTESHTITFTRVLDTFYKDYEISVTATSSGSRTVTIDRCVTKLQAFITDAIPTGAATFNITPQTWYYSWDYISGSPATASTSQVFTLDIPSSEIGVTNEQLNLYGFSSAEEWTTDVTISCKKSDNTILGTATITDVLLKQNCITEYSGPLFSSSGTTFITLNSEWDTAYTGTW